MMFGYHRPVAPLDSKRHVDALSRQPQQLVILLVHRPPDQYVQGNVPAKLRGRRPAWNQVISE